jgi:hypothetical protein
MPPTNTTQVKFFFMRAIISHPADADNPPRTLRV